MGEEKGTLKMRDQPFLVKKLNSSANFAPWAHRCPRPRVRWRPQRQIASRSSRPSRAPVPRWREHR
eukprot:498116-Pleurochrysis_carterae.AAC.1